MVAGFNEDLSREQIQQMEGSLNNQNKAMKEKGVAEKAEVTSTQEPSGEKPGLLRRIWAKVAGESEKYRADMEAYFDKKWSDKQAELKEEVGEIIQDTEKHTEDTIVDLEIKINHLVKAGELDPRVGDELSAQLEVLRAEAKKTASEATKEVDAETTGAEGNDTKKSEEKMGEPTDEDAAEMKGKLTPEDGELLNQIIQTKTATERQNLVKKLYEKNLVSQELNDYLSTIEELQPVFAELQGEEVAKEVAPDEKIQKPSKEVSEAKLFGKLSQADRDLFDLMKDEGSLPNIQKFLAKKYQDGEVSPTLKNYLSTEDAFKKVFEAIDGGQQFETEAAAKQPVEKAAPTKETTQESGVDDEVFSKEFSRYIVGMKLQLVDSAAKHLSSIVRFGGKNPDFDPTFQQDRQRMLQKSSRDAWTQAYKLVEDVSRPNSEFRNLLKTSKEKASQWADEKLASNNEGRLDLEAKMKDPNNSKADLLITTIGRLKIEETILQQLKDSIQYYKTATTETASSAVSSSEKAQEAAEKDAEQTIEIRAENTSRLSKAQLEGGGYQFTDWDIKTEGRPDLDQAFVDKKIKQFEEQGNDVVVKKEGKTLSIGKLEYSVVPIDNLVAQENYTRTLLLPTKNELVRQTIDEEITKGHEIALHRSGDVRRLLVKESAPATSKETGAAPEATQPSIEEQTAALDALLAKKTGLLESEKYKSNYFKRTESEQDKLASFEVYSELKDDDPLKMQTDTNRRGWALADKQAGKTADLNDTQDDYREGTDQFKYQTGEALKQVTEHLRAEAVSKQKEAATEETPDVITPDSEDVGGDDEAGEMYETYHPLHPDNIDDAKKESINPTEVVKKTKEKGELGESIVESESNKVIKQLSREEGESFEAYKIKTETAIKKGELNPTVDLGKLFDQIVASTTLKAERPLALKHIVGSLIANGHKSTAERFVMANKLKPFGPEAENALKSATRGDKTSDKQPAPESNAQPNVETKAATTKEENKPVIGQYRLHKGRVVNLQGSSGESPDLTQYFTAQAVDLNGKFTGETFEIAEDELGDLIPYNELNDRLAEQSYDQAA
ncbi:MAG TPA: hypothetical protein VJH75_00575 [Patescibacteria group bacterium]|nr:hypothetical protein [Patescibacteria group bacterium]